MSRKKKEKLSRFHITIGAAPTVGLDLTHELNLIKVALIYADKATLCSPKALIYSSIAALANAKYNEKIEFLIQMIPILQPEEASGQIPLLEKLSYLSKKRNRSKDELLLKMKFEKALNDAWEKIQLKSYEMIEEAGGIGLSDAILSGVINLKVIGVTDTDKMAEEYLKYVSSSIEKGDTHPLLDELSGKLVSAGIKEGKIDIKQRDVERSKQVHLASDLFSRLPLFEFATVSEILDIRKELDKYLIRFRSGLMRISSSIRSAAWDDDFPFDVEDTVRKEIEPVIKDIEEEVQSNNYLLEVVQKVVNKPLLVTSGSLLGFAVSSMSELPGIVSQAFGVGAAGVLAGIDAHRSWQHKKQEIEKNYLYFYYKMRNSLN